ncbi:MAG: 50S ribosomal protein L29 [Gammaproteobacteria bacterium]
MKNSELSAKTEEDLYKELSELRRELFNLRMNKFSQESAVKTAQFQVVRRNIARIKTFITQKQQVNES